MKIVIDIYIYRLSKPQVSLCRGAASIGFFI